jgi:hypothetical protein
VSPVKYELGFYIPEDEILVIAIDFASGQPHALQNAQIPKLCLSTLVSLSSTVVISPQ